MAEKDYRIFRREWNQQHKALRAMLGKAEQHQQAIKLFLRQHEVLHRAQVAQPETWSYADDLLNGMTESQIRHIPSKFEHSVAWLLWHMARIEDVALNVLVAGSPQILHEGDWLRQMQVSMHHTGNAMAVADVHQLSEMVDVAALHAYRLAVGRRTREIVQQLGPEELKREVDPARIEQVLAEGDIVEAASGIADYWSKRTVAGLLLMPPTRHNMVHLNEIERLKKSM